MIDTAADSRRRTLTLIFLTLASFVNYVDRMVLPALAQPIKREFALSDTELGLLTGFAFVLLYAFAAIPVARLADCGSRRIVLAGALGFWSIATAACGLAKSYSQLLLARLAVGIGESGCQPIGYALIGDYFPPHRRTRATGWFMVGNSLGITVGFAIGGLLGEKYGWRTAFVCVGLPGTLLAVLMAIAMREPPRLALDLPPQTASLWATLRVLFADRAYRWVLIANGVYSFLIFGPIAWLPAYFVRASGLPLRVVGLWTGLTIGLGMAAGMLAGGACADRLLKRSAAAPQIFCMLTVLAAGAAYVLVFCLSDAKWAFVATFFASLAGAMAAPTNAATVQNLCDPRLRAVAASLATLTISLFGVGLAPFVIGVMSDAFALRYGAQALRIALLISLVMSLVTAITYWRLARLLSQTRLGAPKVAIVR